MTNIWPRVTILIKDDEKYGQEILNSLRMKKIWPRNTILIKDDENMAKRYYRH